MIPILLARISPKYPKNVLAWCPYCRVEHLHGIFTGKQIEHRVAHCAGVDSPFNDTGYYLKLWEPSKKNAKRLRGPKGVR